jgi:hypothetical protein
MTRQDTLEGIRNRNASAPQSDVWYLLAVIDAQDAEIAKLTSELCRAVNIVSGPAETKAQSGRRRREQE